MVVAVFGELVKNKGHAVSQINHREPTPVLLSLKQAGLLSPLAGKLCTAARDRNQFIDDLGLSLIMIFS